MNHWVKTRNFPGAVMLVYKKNKLVVDASWGETFYGSRKRPGSKESMYDLASITKSVSTALCIMHLVDQGKVSLGDSLHKHVRATKGWPLGNLTIARLLAHKTSLPPYYFSNYWLLSKSLWNESTFPNLASAGFPDPYRGRFIPKGFRKSMLEDICQLPFQGGNKTRYSDLDYILLGCVIEDVTGLRQDQYLEEWLLRPMGLKNLMYNPLVHGIDMKRVIPTSDKAGSTGWVNDEEAAKLAGVCGAAGLFSNAQDLMTIGRMLQQKGSWNGKSYLKPATIKKFAWQVLPGFAWGQGFQKPPQQRATKSIAPSKASKTAFGHSGFTGTLFWVDPGKDLVVVFLSNCVYPNAFASNFKKNAGYKSVLKMVYDL